jgi:hypothetical protein
MDRWLRYLLPLAVFCSAAPARAADTGTVKCGPHEGRVWVYDTLTSLSVEAMLKCGETVEILGRAKGYVKIRMADGEEGYVADSAMPGLPPLANPGNNSGGEPASVSLVAASEANRAAHHIVTPSALTRTDVKAPSPIDATAKTAEAASGAIGAPASESGPVGGAKHDLPIVSPVAGAASAANATAPLSQRTAPAISQPDNPAASNVTAAAVVQSSTPAPQPESAEAVSAPLPAPPAPPSKKTRSTSTSTPQPATESRPAPRAPSTYSEAVASEPTPDDSRGASLANASLKDIPHREVAKMQPMTPDTESEEFAEPSAPVSESSDPACRIYFSAYGLAPSQIEWIADNRKKEFPGICPAPDPARVDFVILFTHDEDSYGSTLPSPVHTDMNGFSDFSPMVTFDTTHLRLSRVDKARREYVWVFRMQRGAFDPEKFSPRRRYQFTKSESHAPVRTVEDAFQFIKQQGTNR